MSIPIKIKRKADGSIDNITFCPTVTIEKQVWESTLHHSMELEAENTQLKELLKSALSWLNLGWLPDASKFRAGRYAQLQNLKRKINEVLK